MNESKAWQKNPFIDRAQRSGQGKFTRVIRGRKYRQMRRKLAKAGKRSNHNG